MQTFCEIFYCTLRITFPFDLLHSLLAQKIPPLTAEGSIHPGHGFFYVGRGFRTERRIPPATSRVSTACASTRPPCTCGRTGSDAWGRRGPGPSGRSSRSTLGKSPRPAAAARPPGGIPAGRWPVFRCHRGPCGRRGQRDSGTRCTTPHHHHGGPAGGFFNFVLFQGHIQPVDPGEGHRQEIFHGKQVDVGVQQDVLHPLPPKKSFQRERRKPSWKTMTLSAGSTARRVR